MGVLNVTPDSFSDGGLFLDLEAAVAHGVAMMDEGADVIDVGGASTRPGAVAPSAAEEIARAVPVVEALAALGRARISIDTMTPEVARAAVEAGATLINDVSASLWPVAAETGAGWVAMHMQGTPVDMQTAPHYDDVVADVLAFLDCPGRGRRGRALARSGSIRASASARPSPTISALLAALEAICTTRCPVLVGLSRKSFLGALTAGPDGRAARPRTIGSKPRLPGRFGRQQKASEWSEFTT